MGESRKRPGSHMASTHSARRLFTVLLTVLVLASSFVAPVQAGDDDVSIGEDGISVGGDDGTSVSVGDEEGGDGSISVDADSDGVSVDASGGGDANDTEAGGDLSVDAGTDGVDLSAGAESDAGEVGVECDLDADAPGAEDCTTTGDESGGDDGESPVSGGDDALPEGDLTDGPLSDDPGLPTLPALPVEGDESGEDDAPPEVPELPIRYDDVPFESVPGDLCQMPIRRSDIPQPVDPYNPPGEEYLPREIPSTPVDPYNPPVSVPFGPCEVVDPYDPPVDPTNPPDDPDVDYDVYSLDANGDRVVVAVRTEAVTGDGGPEGSDYTYVYLTPNDSESMVRLHLFDGEKWYQTDVESEADPRNRTGTVLADAEVVDRTAGGGLECDGEECEVVTRGLPQQDVPAIPTGGSGGVPCEPPAAPGDTPELPVDPSGELPEEAPEPPELDPSALPDAPNYCFAANPNNPPVDPQDPPQDPYYEQDTYSDDLSAEGGYRSDRVAAGLSRSGPRASSYQLLGFDDDASVYFQRVTVHDGQKSYTVQPEYRWTRDTGDAEGRLGGSLSVKNDSAPATSSFYVVCDGEKCYVTSQGDFGATDEVPPVYVDDEESDDSEDDSGSDDDSGGDSDTSASTGAGTQPSSSTVEQTGSAAAAGTSSATTAVTAAADGATAPTGLTPDLLRDFDAGVPGTGAAVDALFDLV